MKRQFAVLALLALSGCTHYWERSGGTAPDFERESAACIDEARQSSQMSYDAREQIYRACMRSRGWKRVEVSVADDNQFRGPESVKDFINPPPALSGRRYQQR